MKYITISLLMISFISYSGLTWAATCEYCYELIPKGKKYCGECKLKLEPSGDLSGKGFGKEQIISPPKSSRDISGMKYGKEQFITDTRPARNIEVANILFRDGKMYKRSLNFIKRKSRLLSAIKRFKMIINDYADSDKADDAAYELARIYNGFYFKDYAAAAYYYAECYELNPDTYKPAHYMAARVYDLRLKDHARAIEYYELALQTCRIEKYRRIAESRLGRLRKQGP
jgi:tetratricopeptide (TPR) repeat protein